MPPRGIIRLLGWAIVLASVTYCGSASLDAWNSSGDAGGCGRDISLSGNQSAVLLLAIALTTLLFLFLTNLWLVIGLGLISFVVLFFSVIILALGSCGSPSSSTSDVIFFGVVTGTLTVVVAAVLSIPIRLVATVVRSLKKRRAFNKPAWLANVGPLNAAIATMIGAVTIGLLLIAGGWQGIIVFCLLGGVIALAVGVWVSVKK